MIVISLQNFLEVVGHIVYTLNIKYFGEDDVQLSPVVDIANVGKADCMAYSPFVSIIPIFTSYPVKRAALFGSRARGDENNESDFDYFIEFDPEVTSTQYFDLWDSLENALGSSVDILTPHALGQLPSNIKSKIEKEMMWFYER